MLKLIELILLDHIESNQNIETLHTAQVGAEKGLDTGINILRLITDVR